MASVPDPQYITISEVRTQTLIEDLRDLGDADMKILIQTAEDQIDAFVGPQEHHPDDPVTNRVFPRLYDLDDGGNPEIPYKVSRATLRQVEWLYTQWWNDKETAELPVDHPVKQRSIGGDGSYSETLAGEGTDFSRATLSQSAQTLLNGFVSRTAGIDVTDPDKVPSPT